MLQSHFAQTGVVISEVLIDLGQVRTLVGLWNHSHGETVNDRRVVLSVDAVAFRSWVTIGSDGTVRGLENINQLENPDLVEQFLLNPREFTVFLRTHWSKTYSSLFAFRIRPILPHFRAVSSALDPIATVKQIRTSYSAS
jgi:hypothetical protein